MKITFLGTSAATSFPLAFCNCEVCTEARKLGGPNLRKRSSLLINEDLLIDFGPDVMSSSFMYGISIEKIRYCLQTHSHSDHFDASHMITRIPEYATVNVPPLHLYSSKECMKNMSEILKREWEDADLFIEKERERLNLHVHLVENFQSFRFGDYLVTPFPTEHDVADGSLLYAIEERGQTIFYATDTTSLSEDVWNKFHEKKLSFDLVILDHTYGPNINGSGHLNANEFIEHIKRMKKENLLTENCRIFATHISHEGNPIHSQLVEYAESYGYEIAYDGLEVFIEKL